MKRLSILCIVIVAVGVAGFFIGRFTTARAWNRFTEDFMYTGESVEAQQATRVLTYLHRGEQGEARTLLELQLDSALITFATFSSNTAPDSVRRAIRVARDYRRQHPWTNSEPTVAATVQRVFLLVE